MMIAEYFALAFVLQGVGYAIVLNRIDYMQKRPNSKLAKILGNLPVGGLLLVMMLLMASFSLIANEPSGMIVNAVYVTNTLYQLNSTSFIYATGEPPLQAWEGSNPSNMIRVVNETPDVVIGLTEGNRTDTVQIYPGWYFKFNYTSIHTFVVTNS